MTTAYFFYPKEGESIPEGAHPIVGTFFQEEDVAMVYETLQDEKQADHNVEHDELGDDHACWNALTQEQRDKYLKSASNYLESACTYDWVDVVEQAITDVENPL